MSSNGTADMIDAQNLLEEFIQASDRYAETMRTWAKVHLDWREGNAYFDENVAADVARRAALAEVQRLEHLIKGTSAETVGDVAVTPEAYDGAEIAKELGHN